MTRLIAAIVVIAAAGVAAWFFFLRGDSLLAEAQMHSEAACACEEFECTTEHIQFFNRISVTESDRIDALSEEDQETYRGLQSAAADCQDALRE